MPLITGTISPNRVALLALVLLAAVVGAFLLPAAVAAQDPTREEVRHDGAHNILVVPVNLNLGAGSAQYAIFVTHPVTGEPVPDARVVMLATNDRESNPGWAIATNSPAARERYDVNLKLDSTGEWTVSVDVSSLLGADLVDVSTLQVPSVNRLTQGTWVFVGVFVAIMSGIGYVWWSARRNYRRKQAAQADSL